MIDKLKIFGKVQALQNSDEEVGLEIDELDDMDGMVAGQFMLPKGGAAAKTYIFAGNISVPKFLLVQCDTSFYVELGVYPGLLRCDGLLMAKLSYQTPVTTIAVSQISQTTAMECSYMVVGDDT